MEIKPCVNDTAEVKGGINWAGPTLQRGGKNPTGIKIKKRRIYSVTHLCVCHHTHTHTGATTFVRSSRHN